MACCCGAVAPRVTAALLGRFLPRLGPLAPASGPFFFGHCEGRTGPAEGRPDGKLRPETIQSRLRKSVPDRPSPTRNNAPRRLLRRCPVGPQLLLGNRPHLLGQ